MQEDRDSEKLQQLGKFKFADQATWMLNAMWSEENKAHAERLWNFVAMFSELEIENHAAGCDIEAMGSTEFLSGWASTRRCRRCARIAGRLASSRSSGTA